MVKLFERLDHYTEEITRMRRILNTHHHWRTSKAIIEDISQTPNALLHQRQIDVLDDSIKLIYSQ